MAHQNITSAILSIATKRKRSERSEIKTIANPSVKMKEGGEDG